MSEIPIWIIFAVLGIALFFSLVSIIATVWSSFRTPQSASPKMAKSAMEPVQSWAEAEALKAKAALAGLPLHFDPATFTEPRKLRMAGMAIASLILLGVVWYIARQQIGVLLYKALLLTGAAFISYWVDRTAFPDSRPHLYPDVNLRWKYEARRALIISAGMLTAGLGA